MLPDNAQSPLAPQLDVAEQTPVAQIYLNDPETGMYGFIIVDTLVRGKSMGGVRMGPSVGTKEIAALARSMSLKFALGEVPMGGTKGGIVLPRGREYEREELLDAFGRLVEPLLHGGIYLGTDMGISFQDRKRFMDAANFEVKNTSYGAHLPCDWKTFWEECVDIGGFGVSEAAVTLLPLMGLDDRPVTVAIHGFGIMGRGAARHLDRAGHRIVAIADAFGSIECADGLPVETMIEATSAAGTIDRSVATGSMTLSDSPSTCLECEVDVLIIASRQDVVRSDNAGRLRSRLIVEAANHPCTYEAMPILRDRGIAVAPGIVANAGSAMTSGLVVSGSAPAMPTLAALEEWVYEQVSSRIRRNMATIWELSQRTALDMPTTALRLARERVRAAQVAPRSAPGAQVTQVSRVSGQDALSGA